ncbi:hypothetical protein L6164_016665 [Bauhinia variegata]|uniref:Uncharacterized protein n=1 Tax=Bauhinia variegata TaxID=167791 RepID=A0ACB9NQ86_BAUVA|nr:hypothetical protein L6164_016665 [Bauhinia variegata]
MSNNNETAPNCAPMTVDSAANSADESSILNRGPRPMGPSIGHNPRGRSAKEKTVVDHRQGNGVSSMLSSEAASQMVIYETKRFISHDKLAEISLTDPKRAKRILDNRKSAARSKERQICYTNELVKKVKALEAEETSFSIQLSMLQMDTYRLTAENEDLKTRLEAMEKEAELRDVVRRDMVALRSFLAAFFHFD